jgi:hypothetical protein
MPVIMMALEAETKLPFVRGEGPVGVVLCPSVSIETPLFVCRVETKIVFTERIGDSNT